MYHGDIRLGDTIDIKFTTRRFSTGAPFALASGVISAYVGNDVTQITAGITLSADFDGVTGLNNVRVVASGANGYTTATNVQLVITTGTVDSVSVVGEVVGSFSIEARSALMPTTAARTLDVTAANKVNGVVLVDTLTTYTGNTPQTGDSFARLGAPAGASVSADILAVDNLVDDLEARIGTPSDLGSGATVSANLVDIEAQTDDIGVAGAGLTNINLPDQTMNITGDITGNLSGSVGSVTGAVGSVTGLTPATVHADLDDIQARLPAALTAGGNMKADMLAVSGSTASADNLEESTEAIAYGTVDGTGATTTVFLTSAMTPDSAVNDQFNGRVLIFKDDTTTAALRGQATTISDWAHTSAEIGTFTVVALTTAPATGDTFVIL